MVHKPKRGRYLELEDVRVSYNHKDDTIHLTSSDPEIPQGSFFLTLNRNTSTEVALRDLLEEHELIKYPASTQKSTTLASIPSPLSQLVLRSRKNNTTKPFINISGKPGSGKTFAVQGLADMASSVNLKSVILADLYMDYSFEGHQVNDLNALSEGQLNLFQMNISDTNIVELLVSVTQYSEEYYVTQLRNILMKAVSSVSSFKKPTMEHLLAALKTQVNKEKASDRIAVINSFILLLELLHGSKLAPALFGYNDKAKMINDNTVEILSTLNLNAYSEFDLQTRNAVHAFFKAYISDTVSKADLAFVDIRSYKEDKATGTNEELLQEELVKSFVGTARQKNIMISVVSPAIDYSAEYSDRLTFKQENDEFASSLFCGEFIWVTKLGTEQSEMFHVSNIID